MKPACMFATMGLYMNAVYSSWADKSKMPRRIVKDVFEHAESVPNSRGTLKPAEHGVLPRREIAKTAQTHLSMARTDLIKTMTRNARGKRRGKGSWNTYRRLQMKATNIDIGDIQEESESGILDVSVDEENLAASIDPSVLEEYEMTGDPNDIPGVVFDNQQVAEDRHQRHVNDDRLNTKNNPKIDDEPFVAFGESEADDCSSVTFPTSVDTMSYDRETVDEFVSRMRQEVGNTDSDQEERETAMQLASDIKQSRLG